MSPLGAGGVIFSSGECSRISGTTRLRNLSSISIRLFLNGFANTLSTNVAFASLPASSRAKATIGVLSVLVVEQREERDLERRVGAGDAGARRGKARILDVADAHARLDVGRRRAVDDHLGAAVVDVVMRREDRDRAAARAGPGRPSTPCSTSVRRFRNDGRVAVTTMRAGPDCSSGTLCLPIGRVMRDQVGAAVDVASTVAPVGRVEREQREWSCRSARARSSAP